MPDETSHERHNRLAFEIAQRMVDEVPLNIERLVLLESIVSGTLRLMAKNLHTPAQRVASQQKLFDALIPGIKERLRVP